MIMNNSPQIYVSVDIGCRQHSVAIGLSNGDVLDEFAILYRPEGFKQFFERIEHHRQHHGGAVTVAMEGLDKLTTNVINLLPFVLSLSKDLIRVS